VFWPCSINFGCGDWKVCNLPVPVLFRCAMVIKWCPIMLTFQVIEVKFCSVLEVAGLFPVVFFATDSALLSWHLRL
jgi:hypothetical protein